MLFTMTFASCPWLAAVIPLPKVGMVFLLLQATFLLSRVTDFSLTLHPASTDSRQKLPSSQSIDPSLGRNRCGYLEMKNGREQRYSALAHSSVRVSFPPATELEASRLEHMLSLRAFKE